MPYRGSAPVFTDLIGGQVNYTFDALAIAQPHIEAGKLRALATTGAAAHGGAARRADREGYAAEFRGGELVRHGGARRHARGDRRRGSTRRWRNALRQPDVAQRAATLGLDLVGSTPERSRTLQRAEIAKWGEVIRTAKVQAD